MGRKRIDRKDKQLHREFVWLSESEREHLLQLMLPAELERWIGELNGYIGAKGSDPYASHYYVIQNWHRRAVEKNPSASSGQAQKAKRAADRVMEALKDPGAPMPTDDLAVRSALYAMLTKKNLTWPKLRAILKDDPTKEPAIRTAFIAEYRS